MEYRVNDSSKSAALYKTRTGKNISSRTEDKANFRPSHVYANDRKETKAIMTAPERRSRDTHKAPTLTKHPIILLLEINGKQDTAKVSDHNPELFA
jgi:hypothetical protein